MSQIEKSCCPKRRPREATPPTIAHIECSPTAVKHEEVALPANAFLMGDHFEEGYHSDGETPVHPAQLDAFSIDVAAVSNAQFAAFILETDYKTEAEAFGDSTVFHHNFVGDPSDILGKLSTNWWLVVKGACWQHPNGPESTIDDIADHPVTHVSHTDALAYCSWAGRDLPTEAEWEYAARGGLRNARYPWGDQLEPNGEHRANIWQGIFPEQNDVLDGWQSTAPVKTFTPNGFGLWQTAGNVWEWCADWFSPRAYEAGQTHNPQGPVTGKARVIRGGSYLCHASYCNRYRVAARSSSTPNSSTGHVGFRTVSRYSPS